MNFRDSEVPGVREVEEQIKELRERREYLINADFYATFHREMNDVAMAWTARGLSDKEFFERFKEVIAQMNKVKENNQLASDIIYAMSW